MTKTAAELYAELDDFAEPADFAEGRADARQVLKAWMVAIDDKDLPGVRALMSDDIVIEIPFNESGRNEDGFFRVYTGVDECCGFWATAFAAEGHSEGLLDAEVTQSRDGRTTFAEGRGELTMADGRSYRNRYVMRMVVEQGRVRHVREYYNPITSAHAFGRKVAGQFLLETLTPSTAPSTP